MAVKEWGYVLAPRPTFDQAMRSNFLIGYPFAFNPLVSVIKQWGFVHKPRATFDGPMRSEFLIGYPFGFASITHTAKNYYTGGRHGRHNGQDGTDRHGNH
jgi:hypothetical protein